MIAGPTAMMKRTSGDCRAALGMTQPAWLAPHRPIRWGSMPGWVLAQAIAVRVSSARSCMLWFSQLPGALSMPGLSHDRVA
ncbi:hypothetical protein [Amycolatopsis sp. WAC 01376]|uniref:hypothetical protein n=1 Tax=Amycolatopsis sp. WAC 01376 TaxID=2203195 RepID=UPI0018F522FC|nr:hypothetical protein [Amycolatopsis sp. WAC 01376]